MLSEEQTAEGKASQSHRGPEWQTEPISSVVLNIDLAITVNVKTTGCKVSEGERHVLVRLPVDSAFGESHALADGLQLWKE